MLWPCTKEPPPGRSIHPAHERLALRCGGDYEARGDWRPSCSSGHPTSSSRTRATRSRPTTSQPEGAAPLGAKAKYACCSPDRHHQPAVLRVQQYKFADPSRVRPELLPVPQPLLRHTGYGNTLRS
jgi:hypothetical protein